MNELYAIISAELKPKQEAKIIWQSLHQMRFPLSHNVPWAPRIFTPNRTWIRSAVFAHQSQVKPRDKHTD